MIKSLTVKIYKHFIKSYYKVAKDAEKEAFRVQNLSA
jgi:hypothetical protein